MLEDQNIDKIEGEQEHNEPHKDQPIPTREELVEQLDAYIKNFEKLPPHAQFGIASLCDIYYPLLIILGILRK